MAKRRAITFKKYEQLGLWTLHLSCGHTKVQAYSERRPPLKSAICTQCK